MQILRPDGTHLAMLLGKATLSKRAQKFLEANPEAEKRFGDVDSVRVAGTGRLYVTESSQHRVQIYEHV